MTERDFTEFYIKNMLKSYPDAKYYIINDLTVKADYNGKEFSHYLDNAFKEYKIQPDSVDEVVKRL